MSPEAGRAPVLWGQQRLRAPCAIAGPAREHQGPFALLLPLCGPHVTTEGTLSQRPEDRRRLRGAGEPGRDGGVRAACHSGSLRPPFPAPGPDVQTAAKPAASRHRLANRQAQTPLPGVPEPRGPVPSEHGRLGVCEHSAAGGTWPLIPSRAGSRHPVLGDRGETPRDARGHAAHAGHAVCPGRGPGTASPRRARREACGGSRRQAPLWGQRPGGGRLSPHRTALTWPPRGSAAGCSAVSQMAGFSRPAVPGHGRGLRGTWGGGRAQAASCPKATEPG